MSDNIKRLAEARQKKGWTQEEIEAFAERRAKELKKISGNNNEPDYLASGMQTPGDDEEDKLE